MYNYQTETPETRSLVSQYINFDPVAIRASNGKAQMVFTTNSQDANLYFETFIDVKDNKGNSAIKLLSNQVKIQVRGDRLFASSFKIDNTHDEPELISAEDSGRVSEYTNLFLVDENQGDVHTIFKSINNNSLAKEKLVFSLSNYAKSGARLALSYPLNVSLFISSQEAPIKQMTLRESDLANFKPFLNISSSGEYTMVVDDADGYSFEKTFFIAPDVAVKGNIQVGSTVLESKGAITTNIVTLYDRFNNPASGELYNLEGKIS